MIVKKLIFLGSLAVVVASCFSVQAMEKRGREDQDWGERAKRVRLQATLPTTPPTPPTLLSRFRQHARVPQILWPAPSGAASDSEVDFDEVMENLIHNLERWSDEEVFQGFNKLSMNPEADAILREKANLYKAQMRVCRRTEAIDDEETFQILHEVSESEEALPWVSEQASFYKAQMRVDRRTKAIDDEEAFQVFHGVSERQEAFSWVRNQANLYKAQLRMDHRTKAINDEEAFQIFHGLSENQEALPWVRARSNLQKARMRFARRINVINDAIAIGLLENVHSDPTATETDRHHAYNHLRMFEERARQRYWDGVYHKLEPIEKDEGQSSQGSSTLGEALSELPV